MSLYQSRLYGGISCREYWLEPGETIPAHIHSYEHMSIVLSGSVEMNGETFTAPHFLSVPVGLMHEVKAVTKAVWLCLISVREVEATRGAR